MLFGICSNCGEKHYGWALMSCRYQICRKCGLTLIISKEDSMDSIEAQLKSPNKHNNFVVNV